MRKLISFLALSTLIILIILSSSVLAATINLYSESNAGSGGVIVTNSANADGSTTGNSASAVDNNDHWSADGADWMFTMADSSNTAAILNVSVYLSHFQSGHSNDGFDIDVYDGVAWTTLQSYGGTSPPTTNTTDVWDLSSILNTWAKINNSQLRIIGTGKSGGHDAVTWYVDTVELKVIIDPVITSLDYPENNSYLNNESSINFNFTVKDASGFTNATLYGNWSDGWHANQSIYNITINNASTSNFTALTLSEGKYIWNVLVYNNASASQSTWFSENYSFTIDTTKPLIDYGVLTPSNNSYQSNSNIFLNVTITEINIDTITFNLYYSNGSAANISSNTAGTRSYNFTSLSDNTYKFNVTVNDSAGNSNSTVTRTVIIDTTNPLIDYGVGTNSNNSHLNFNSIYVNVSVNETNEDTIIFSLFYQNGSSVNSSSYSDATRNINWTDLIDEDYIYNITVNDSAGNSNSTVSRIIIVDTTNPRITLNSPANDSISQDRYKLLNLTVTDNRDEIIVKLYGGNESGFFNNNSLIYKRTGLANNTEVTYNWTAPVLNVTTDTQLLMHFDLEGGDNATFVHDETGVNNGTKLATGAPVWNESGKFAYALGFDGVDDTISISDSNSLDLNESFSISFWTYPRDLSKNQTFLSKGSGTTATNYFIDYKTTTELEFGFYNGDFRSVAVDASTLIANQWNLITTTLNDSSNISRVYINGVDKGSLKINYDVLANSFDLKLASFPGYNQNFSGLIDELVIYNKTLSADEVSNIYQLKDDNWYWRVDLNDTSSNLNISETRVFTVGSIWEVSPIDLGSVGAVLNANVSAGILTINNTHANRNVSINITHDFNGTIIFNESMPFNLSGAGGNWSQVQINVTSPSTESSTTINFNISATDYSNVDSVPASRIVPLVLITTSGNPFLISKFETVPSVVSQNNTGISLKASVINKGQGNAQNVKINYELPSGWTNSSGALISNAFLVNVNTQVNYSIEVDIAGNATSGVVTLYANLSGQNDTGGELNSSYKTIGEANVTVNAISAGAGPSTTTTVITTTTSSGGGGGGGSGAAGGSGAGGIIFSKIIEVARSESASFNIEIYGRYTNATLGNLTLTLTGYPEQYVSISPKRLDNIMYGETKNFSVRLTAPSYKEYEEHTLKVIIRGNIFRDDGSVAEYSETQNIKLIIQERSNAESRARLNEAEKAIALMIEAGYNTDEVLRLLEDVKKKLSEGRNEEVFGLSQRIIEIKDKAFSVGDFINSIISAILNPKKTNLLTGAVIQDSVDAENKRFKFDLSGRAVFSSNEVQELLNLAIAAFNRGDYDTAFERAKEAQLALILERKGNFGLFFYLYWHLVILGVVAFVITGVFGYRRYQKSSVSRRIEDINKEENNIAKLAAENQKDYFSAKISSNEYHSRMKQHQKKLARIKKSRIQLRNRRIKMLKSEDVLRDLKIETMQVEGEIKKLQRNYYVDKRISENEYKTQFDELQERLAEIESERTTLDLIKHKKGSKKERRELKKEGKGKMGKKGVFGRIKENHMIRNREYEKGIKDKINKMLGEK